jgi:hypothetical protein
LFPSLWRLKELQLPRIKTLSISLQTEYSTFPFPEFPDELRGSGYFTDLSISFHGSRYPISELLKWPLHLERLAIFEHNVEWRYQFDDFLAELACHSQTLKSLTIAKQGIYYSLYTHVQSRDDGSRWGDNTFDLSNFPNLEHVGMNLHAFAASSKTDYKKLLAPPRLKHIHWYRGWPAVEDREPKSTLYMIARHVAKYNKALKNMTLDGPLLVKGNRREDVSEVGDAVKSLLKLKRALGSLGIDLAINNLIGLNVDFPRFCRDLEASNKQDEEWVIQDLWQEQQDT